MNALQPTLFEPLPQTVAPDVDRDASIQERFEAFHAANPHVYERLVRLALQLKRQGRQHFGIKALIEFLRFSYALQTTGEPYKLDNRFSSRYARYIMETVPELDGFFETRELKAA